MWEKGVLKTCVKNMCEKHVQKMCVKNVCIKCLGKCMGKLCGDKHVGKTCGIKRMSHQSDIVHSLIFIIQEEAATSSAC